jgi:Mn2+/Fe2+ NRAMP family transporter
VKNLLKVALGIATSIGGFLEVGSISTAAQAGASYGFQLVWAVVLATVLVMFLVEMSGRLAACSGHPLAAAVRERFGFRFQVVPLVAETVLDGLVLAAEVGGVCIALHLMTGVSARWWAVPVALGAWLLLWRGTFGAIENGVSLLGLLAVVFVLAAWRLHPPWTEAARGLVPSLSAEDPARYSFLAVSILGATLSPYLFNFYSSGAVEDEWDETHLGVNRATAVLGMAFGGVMSLGILVTAALVLRPRGIQVESYHQAALMLTPVFPFWGFVLFAVVLGVACFGAVLEIALNMAYLQAQSLGWDWSENLRPKDDARFSLVYTVALALSASLMVLGVDPLRLTLLAMSLTVIVLPLIVVPFLVIMNDEKYLGEHRNGLLGNLVVLGITLLGFLLAVVAVPLQVAGGS